MFTFAPLLILSISTAMRTIDVIREVICAYLHVRKVLTGVGYQSIGEVTGS